MKKYFKGSIPKFANKFKSFALFFAFYFVD